VWVEELGQELAEEWAPSANSWKWATHWVNGRNSEHVIIISSLGLVLEWVPVLGLVWDLKSAPE